jgi:uncharacterized protein YndB with AHSA1/START domain
MATTGNRVYWAVFACALALPGHAEVKQAAPDTMLIAIDARIAAPPSSVYDNIAHVERWWSSSHTYSGDAANMSLIAEPGGCFCERWKDGAIEHGRVVSAMRNQMLRLSAALGPLQARAVNAMLTFQLKPADGGTALTLGYIVNGASASALDKSAPAVDGVLNEQVQRLKRLIETGKPGD